MSRARLQLRRYGRSFMVYIGLVIVGVVAGAYILTQQRFPNPFKSYYKVNAAFPTAAAVVPGLGEPVDVAGVHVGQILGVQLHAGQGIVQMEIDPSKGVRHIYTNAHAMLVANTPLKDMYVDIDPGGGPGAKIAPSGFTIPVADSTSPVDSDELLDELDVDTRNWFTSLISSLAQGTAGQGPNIRRLLTDLGPTAQETRQIADLLAQRRAELASLVHNFGVMTSAAAQDDNELGTLVDASNRTIGALASESSALRVAVRHLPGTLQTAQRTFGDLTGFANQLTPTATNLIPFTRNLPTTLKDTRTLVGSAALLPIGKIKSFERAVAPLTLGVEGATTGLRHDIPALTQTFKGLEYVTNELAYVPGNGNPGMLYWLAWFGHNIDSFVGNHDANGSAWRSLIISSCSQLQTINPTVKTLLTTVLGSFGCSS